MYPTTYQTGGARRPTPRTWLAAGGALVALLVVLFLVLAACQNAGTDQTDPLGGAASGTPAPDTSAAPSVDGIGGNGGGNPDQNDPGNGGDPGGGDPPPDPEDPGEEEPEPEPLSIEPVITEVAPNGHCSASGTITVEGGEYPLTVDFQWRRLTFAAPLLGEPVSPLQSHTFDEPGGINVQTKDLPEDGTNVFLTVSSPKSASAGPAEYDGCSGQAGGGSFDS